MFISRIKHRCGYNRDDEQLAWGYFMYWFQFLGHHYLPEEKPADLAAIAKDDPFYTTIYATVRYTKMRQLGHWMMGHIQVGPMSLGVSGSLGSDGLPASLWDNNTLQTLGSVAAINAWTSKHFEVVPPDVREAWGKDTGHNTCNSKAVHDYGADLFKRMYAQPKRYAWRRSLVLKRKPWIIQPKPLSPTSMVSADPGISSAT